MEKGQPQKPMTKLSRFFKEQIKSNLTMTAKENKIENRIISDAIDTQRDFRDYFNWTLCRNNFSNAGPAEAPIFLALLKNEYALYASLELTNQGLYGPSRALLRSCLLYTSDAADE